MTDRLYYRDADLDAFDARVVLCRPAGDRFHVVLDRTAFYPTSGGQPFDTGQLGGARVVDVVDDESTGDVVHVVTASLVEGAGVRGEIDRERRRDHRQQHTGQHVLSAVLDTAHEAPTVSVHFGADACTIDVARDLSAAELDAAEREANRVVWRDVPVEVIFVAAADAAALPLRKPTHRTGEVRLIRIGDVDLSACGGTHVASTGALGLVAVTGWERFKGGTRISFACGERARVAHGHLRDVAASIGRQLSVGVDDLPAAVERLAADLRERQKESAALQRELAVHRAEAWRAAAETIGALRVVIRNDPAADAAALKGMAQAIVTAPGFVALLLGGGMPVPIVVARSADVDLDAGAIVRAATTALGGRGGGRAELAQGGVPAAAGEIVAFLRQSLAP